MKGKGKSILLAKPLAKKVKHASKGAVMEVTKEIYSQLNTVYKKWAGKTFPKLKWKRRRQILKRNNNGELL